MTHTNEQIMQLAAEVDRRTGGRFGNELARRGSPFAPLGRRRRKNKTPEDREEVMTLAASMDDSRRGWRSKRRRARHGAGAALMEGRSARR